MKRHFLALLLLLLPLLFSAAAPGPSGRDYVNPSAYPVLGDEELGQLGWALMVADQPIEDFSMIGWSEEGVDTSYRYTIAFTAYFLALEQYEKLPAWSERIQPALDRLIRKMIARPSWEYWARVSQGVPRLEPMLDRPYPESHDPVADQNIMYSGHLGHMIGLYEMLYHDFKWDRPGSIVFYWSDDEKYVYDNYSLQMAMHRQMKNNPWNSIACEPNAVFPSCNQHPVMSFMLYDQTHGTTLASVSGQFMDFFLKQKLINPTTHHAAAYYLVKQGITVSGGRVGISPSMDGWAGSFMHAWQPDYIERHYPYMRRDLVVWEDGGRARLRMDLGPGQSLKYGFFGMLAGEVGDLETRDKLVNYADEIYRPRWEGGVYGYFGDGAGEAKMTPTPLTNPLLGLARANRKDGLREMHNRPHDDGHFSEPRITGVDTDRLMIRRAVYDRDKRTLVVTVAPGDEKGGKSAFVASSLDPAKSYVLVIDGDERGAFSNSETAKIEVSLDRAHDIILAESTNP